MSVVHTRVLVYNNANYASSNDIAVRRAFRGYVGTGNLRSRVGVMRANYFNLYTLNPIIVIRPSNAFCDHMRTASIRRVIARRLLGNHIIRHLICGSANSSRPIRNGISLGSATFCGARGQIILHGYNIVSPRSVSRCVTVSNCTTLNGILARVAPRSIVGAVASSNLHNHNNNNFPANHG